MLGEYGVDAAPRLIGVLGGVQQLPFAPEALNASNDDACPDLASGLDESDGPYIRKVGRVKNFG